MDVKIIYGTAWYKGRTTELVVSAVLNGLRAIDTACQPKHYREDLVGDALQILYDKHGFTRADLFLQTKHVFTPVDGQDRTQALPYDPTLPVDQQIGQSFARSLSHLRTDFLDAYILHSPLRTYAQTLAAWRVFCALQDAGRVRAIGISNVYDVRVLNALVRDGGRRVDVVQDRWYEGNGWDADVVGWCRANGAQYQSVWTLTGSPSLVGHAAVARVGRAVGCTPAQVVYRLAQELGVTPLSGTTSEEHMREDVAVEGITLTRAQVAELRLAMGSVC
ncbi:Aldo/keto reductase [Vararia minispora EC-137]|uniref:Aldo/keto reductase n=1 Tax=Vararia minispora EC-137 TaxID=1314806 RepID=A0ACB8QWC5_9AGAM|nr:Aldo/keto reductase [Vararia minispora EC-137]